MNRFFHVDRTMKLYEGEEIVLEKNNNVKSDELLGHINFLYPDGISLHGKNYILREIKSLNNCTMVNSSQLIEYLFEYVRKGYYSQRPSRFQSVFAFDNIEKAKFFQDKYCNSQGNIWEIESEESFKVDMNLLTLGNSLLEADYCAHLYWKGETTGNPFWEYLLVPPVKVIRKVDG